jgi:hypothetical protein
MARRALAPAYLARTLRGSGAHPKKLVGVFLSPAKFSNFTAFGPFWLARKACSKTSTSALLADQRRAHHQLWPNEDASIYGHWIWEGY